jgi:hypothetical protein
MDKDNKYQEVKRRLSDLRWEANDLPKALAAALTTGDAGEASRLRQRQKKSFLKRLEKQS